MNRVRLFKRAPFRLALVLGVLIVLAYGLGAILAARVLDNRLASRLDILVRERFSTIGEEYASGDRRSFVMAVDRHAQAALNLSSIYQLRTDEGQVLAGNVDTDMPTEGLSTLDGSAAGGDETVRYRVLHGRVKDLHLIVGLSNQDNHDIRRDVYDSAGIAALVTLLLTLSGGAWLAHQSQRRLNELGNTLQTVADGDLKTRLAISSHDDDVDALARQINSMLDELQSLIVAVDQISSDVAHDLKTPISHLFISLDEATTLVGTGNEPLQSKLAEAESELSAINETFDALLRLSRIESQSRRIGFGEVQLNELLERLVDHWQPVALEQQQALLFADCSDQLLIVSGDENLLTQLIVNLVTNSLRYSPFGAAITVSLDRVPSKARIRIADNGPGIPEAERTRVFQRLYRMDKARSAPGFGLGLSLVKAIAKLHDAKVTLSDNEPGLLVTVDMPLIRTPA